MKPISSRLLPVVLVGVAVALALPLGASATVPDTSPPDTTQPGTTQPDTTQPDTAPAAPTDTAGVPAGCVEATPYDGSPDVPNDYRCAGLALDFHHAGPLHSRHPIWAGQYLFVDEAGRFHRGTCTFNLGSHPTATDPSYPVALDLPRDPDGRKSGYLLWRYGDTTDDLTAAAMWAVMHYYARDAGGGKRSEPASAALVPSLDMLAEATGRADLEERAVALAAEADRFYGLWTLDLILTPDGTAIVRVLSEANPVPAYPIALLVSGSDSPLAATTGDDGIATVTVPLPPSGTVTVAAVIDSAGRPQAFRGTPAAPSERGAQTLMTAGDPVRVTVNASLELVAPTTEPPTTQPPTTDPPTTEPATTQPATTQPATSELPTSEPVPTTSDVVRMPVTGAGGDGMVAYLATASLVGGVGLVGALRRRGQAAWDADEEPAK